MPTLFLGRTEYTVRSVDSVTGRERWNVTYGVGLYKLNRYDPEIESAWFQPLNL